MTTSVSTKVRTIGGASMLALSAGLTGTALAQMAPAPLVAAPTPTAPTPPANAAECVVISGTVVCPPGTDPDGFFDLSDNPLGLDIQDGAVVQGPVIITGAVTGAVDGSIQTGADGDGGLAAGAGSDVTIGGFIQTDGQFSVAVEAGDGSSVVNDGTIYTTGDNFSDAVSLGADSSFTNNGLVQTDGAESFGVFGPASGINVTNSVTGSIITSGTGSAAVGLLDNAVVNNAGLVQTFGDFSVGIDTQESGSVTNSGNIATAGEESFGIGVRDGSSVTNSGAITTSGEIAHGISAITNATIVNSGSITTSGDFASGVSGLANTNLSNSGTIATSGVLADAVSVRGGSVVSNSGTISTSGDEAIAVFGFGNNVSITNTAAGNITTDGLAGFGIVVLDGATVVNDGAIATTGEFGIAIDTQEAADVTNNGSITTAGDEGVGIGVRSDSTVTNTGSVTTAGTEAHGIVALNTATIVNSGSVDTTGDTAFGIRALADAQITNSGDVSTAGAASRALSVTSGATVNNSGTLSTSGDGSFALGATDGLTLVNSGSIETTGNSRAIDARDGATITNEAGGTIFAAGATGTIRAGANLALVNNGMITNIGVDAKVIDAGDGLGVTNNGQIVTASGIAIDGGNLATISNTGLIQGGQNDAIALNSGAITNSGTIESLSSNPNGPLVIGGTTPELDAGINFEAGDGGNEDGAVTNLAGGIIRGDIGIAASSGNQANPAANDGSQQVVNFGTIIGRTGDAALLGNGDDEFQQWTGASVTGNIDLEAGDDTFILEGSASSVAGSIFGGLGNDTAIIAGTLDADNFFGFETFQIGSDLGGTLNDARIVGDRTVDGDVVVVGEVVLGLGVDSLTSTGAMTLENTAVITIETPLDVALIGQTVTVLQDGTGFTDNGAVINIIDDDLLVDYVPVIGSLAVQVNAVNPLANATDPNVAAFGLGLTGGLNAGTLSQANFDLVNNLPDFDAYQALALDALPNLNEGAGREIFESSSAASDALNRHLLSDESGVWAEFILRGADQDGFSASQGGYESSQTIFTVGGDFVFGEMGQIGVLASYADIENDDLGANGALRGQTDIESIKLGVYVATSFAERGFLNGEVAYLTGEIESTRAGALGTINSAQDFDGFAYSAVVGFDLLPDENVSLTPSVGINGATISFDDAVEAGGFGFTVARDDAEFFELRGAVEFGAQVSDKVDGFVRGTIIHDLSDDQRLVTLNSAQLTPFTTVLPLREQDRFELAAGASVDVTQNVSFELGYLGDFADGYDAHSAHVTARIAF
ncbi:MAG: autotransporter domain-containing protein [Erythrobacter sp.]|uniref:autotransporter domain-containing protein n=1 Tax=Erythrobacter sp. TaxID=1042 RepID=UPI003A844C71